MNHVVISLILCIDNKVVNNLFGMTTGLGYMPTTFDWSQIAYNTSPLTIPFWAQANVFAGWFCIYAVIAPILYYTNTWYTAHLPLTGSDAYDNTGNLYNSTRILNDEGAIDDAKYREYSPIFLPITFALCYGVGFAVLSCLLTHVVLYHSKDILDTFRGQNKKDVHARLLSRYPDVAWWWYAILTVSPDYITTKDSGIDVERLSSWLLPLWSNMSGTQDFLSGVYLLP